MNAPVPLPLLPALAAALAVFVAGAWIGRLLCVLLEEVGRESGLPSPHYGRPGPGSGPLRSIPILGRLAPGGGRASWPALAVEAAAGASFVLSFELFPPAKAACAAVLLLGLLGAAAVDFEHTIIPEIFTVGLAAVGLALSAVVPALHGCGSLTLVHGLRSLASGLLGLAIGSSLGLWLAVLGEFVFDREVLGFGDVKFLGAIGAFCGWQGAVFSVFGGAFIGAAAILAAEAGRRMAGSSSSPLFRGGAGSPGAGRLGWGAEFPFGPMLAAAAALYFLALHPAVDRVLSPLSALY